MKPTAAELLADRPRLRALLATEVMGWEVRGPHSGPWALLRGRHEYPLLDENSWTPDLRIDQAFEVVEKLQPGNFWFELRSNQTGTAAYFLSDDEMYSASAETPALAICLAALRAAGATE